MYTSNYHTLEALDPYATDVAEIIDSGSADAHYSMLHESYGTSRHHNPSYRSQTGVSFGSFGYGPHFGAPSHVQPLHYSFAKMRAPVCPKCRCDLAQ